MNIHERIFEFSPDALLVIDGAGRIAKANALAGQMFGYRRDELIGHPVEMLIPGRFSEAHVRHRRSYLSAPYLRPMGAGMKLSGCRKDGSEFAVDIMLGPVATPQGPLILCAVRDTTEREWAAAINIRLAAIVASATDAIIGKDLEGVILSWNPAAEGLFGYRADEVVGRNIEILIPPDRLAEEARILQRIRQGERVEPHETVRRRKDGSLVDVWLTSSPVKDARGAVVGASKFVRDITERKRADEQRRLHEERVRAVFEAGLIGMAIASAQHRFLEVNDALAAMLGVPMPALVGRCWEEFIHPDDLAASADLLERRLAGESSGQRLSVRLARAAGSVMHAEIAARAVRADDGSVRYLVLLVQDVTEQRQAERKLRMSEARLREAQELAKVGSWELDLVKNALTWSTEIHRIFESSPTEFDATYEHFLQQVHPDDRERVDRAYTESVANHVPYETEHRLLMKDGRIKVVHERGRTTYDEQGMPLRSVGTVQDITERKAMEHSLRESESRLAGIIDTALDAIVSIDAQRRVIVFNRAAETMFQVPAAQAVVSTIERFIPRWQQDAHRVQVDAHAAPGGAARAMGSERMLTGLRANGEAFPLEVSISQVTVNGKQLLTAILRDVTDRVRAERELVRYQLELTELTHQLMDQEKNTTSRLAQVLHDQLGQTLAAMRIDFVREAQMPDAPRAARHARVDRLIDEATREVRQVLAELRPNLLDERGLVEALENEISARQLASGDMLLRLEIQPGLEDQRWSADVEYAVFMVAREAITNALRHAHATLVRVALTGGANALRMAVIDDGTGIVEDSLKSRPGHLGMVGMRERSLAIGARFEVRADPDGGTAVCLTWEERPA